MAAAFWASHCRLPDMRAVAYDIKDSAGEHVGPILNPLHAINRVGPQTVNEPTAKA